MLDGALLELSGINPHKQNGLIGVAVLANKACKNAVNAAESERNKVCGGLEKTKVNYEEADDQTQSQRCKIGDACFCDNGNSVELADAAVLAYSGKANGKNHREGSHKKEYCDKAKPSDV